MYRPSRDHRYLADTGDAVIDLIPGPRGWFITVLSTTSLVGTRKAIWPTEFADEFAAFGVQLPAQPQWNGRWTGTYGRNPYEAKELRGHAYIIQGKLTGFIKIGASISLRNRLAMLQSVSPDELVVLRALPGGFQTEAALHKRFAADRHHGEWFLPSEDLLRFIDIVTPAMLYPLLTPEWRNGANQPIDPPALGSNNE